MKMLNGRVPIHSFRRPPADLGQTRLQGTFRRTATALLLLSAAVGCSGDDHQNVESATTVTTATTVAPFDPQVDLTIPATGRVADVVGVVAGAENTTNPCAPPVRSTASGSGKVRHVDGSFSDLREAINDSEPGDLLLLADGNYSGELTIEISGTERDPIVIRSERDHGAVWDGGSIAIAGSYVQLAGLKITSPSLDVIRVTGHSTGVRLSGLIFDETGSGEGASSIGVIKIDGHPDWVKNESATDPLPIPIRRDVTIDSNQFLHPRNAPLWVMHGSQGVAFCHNAIVGPHGMVDGETEALKFGSGDGLTENSDSLVAFNTITNWTGRPYVVGIKMSGVRLIGNVISNGRVEIRSANRTTILGNVILDGDLHVGGAGNRIEGNYVRMAHDADGFGPFVMYASSGDPPRVGDGNWFYLAFTSSLVRGNVFSNIAGSAGFAVIMGHAQLGTTGQRASENVFEGNILVSETNGSMVIDNGHDADTVGLIAANTWTNNQLVWSGGSTSPLPGIGNSQSTVESSATAVPTLVHVAPEDLVR